MATEKKRIRKLLIAIAAFTMLLLAAEFIFDFIEIGLGSLLETGNSFRPKTGTVWELNKSDLAANEQLSQITDAQSGNASQDEISNLADLKKALDENDYIYITREQFLNIYNALPVSAARVIVPPLDLLKVIESRQWIHTKIVKTDNSLNFFLLDGSNQLLFDSYPDLSVFYNIQLNLDVGAQRLEAMSEFTGRIIAYEQFYRAFSELPNSLKLQLINDPYFLIRHNEQIEFVAVSGHSIKGTVNLGFEINSQSADRIQIFQSSAISVNYLISRLNALYDNLNLTFPDIENEISE